MNFALVHRRFTTNGGTERYLVGFARFLVAEGHVVTVVCSEVREDLRREPGVTFVIVPKRARGLAAQVAFFQDVGSVLDAPRFDRVMGFGRSPGHDLYRAGGGSHADYLRRLHPLRRRFSPADWIETELDRRAVLSARIVLANSRLGASGLVADYMPPRVEVVYNGVDLDRFRPDGATGQRVRGELGVSGHVAVFLGNGFRRKGLDLAIAALPAGWTLLVVGHDPPWPAPPSVRFLAGTRDPERMLQAADVMILPTRYDPFANACLEALACGVPVLTTSANGAAEILPEPWMVCDDLPAFIEAFSRVTPELGARCRAVAEALPARASYARALELLVEAS